MVSRIVGIWVAVSGCRVRGAVDLGEVGSAAGAERGQMRKGYPLPYMPNSHCSRCVQMLPDSLRCHRCHPDTHMLPRDCSSQIGRCLLQASVLTQ